MLLFNSILLKNKYKMKVTSPGYNFVVATWQIINMEQSVSYKFINIIFKTRHQNTL